MSKAMKVLPGMLVKVYECSCSECDRVERLYPSVVNSRHKLWKLGWHRNRKGAWFCPQCRPQPYLSLQKKVPKPGQYKPIA